MAKLKPWTDEEVEIVKARYRADGPTILAAELGRTKSALMRKAYYLGLTKRNKGEMTAAEISQLRKLHEATRQRAAHLDPARHAKRREIVTKYLKGRRAACRERGVCIRCGEPVIEHNTSYCLLHWAAVLGHTCKRRDGAFAKLMLAKLEEQNYTCALTGDKLIPSLNCSVDHIVPKSKGGAIDDPNNLRWVTVDANRAKGDLSDEEFFAFCQRVIEHNK